MQRHGWSGRPPQRCTSPKVLLEGGIVLDIRTPLLILSPRRSRIRTAQQRPFSTRILRSLVPFMDIGEASCLAACSQAIRSNISWLKHWNRAEFASLLPCTAPAAACTGSAKAKIPMNQSTFQGICYIQNARKCIKRAINLLIGFSSVRKWDFAGQWNADQIMRACHQARVMLPTDLAALFLDWGGHSGSSASMQSKTILGHLLLQPSEAFAGYMSLVRRSPGASSSSLAGSSGIAEGSAAGPPPIAFERDVEVVAGVP